MKSIAPGLDEYRELYQAAEDFKRLACWNWLSDIDIFGVQDPVSGEIGYASVLGAGKDIFGLAFYLGEEGLASLLRLLDQEERRIEDPDRGLDQRCLLVSFEDRDQLAKEDLETIKALGLKFRGRKQWPCFRSFRPGYHPWFLEKAEAQFLTVALKQAQDVACACRENPNYLLTAEGEYLVRVPERQEGGLSWSSKLLRPRPAPMAEMKLAVNRARIRAVEASCKLVDAVWEVDASLAPIPIQEEKGSRPYYPRIFLCVDAHSRLILSYDMLPSGDLPRQLQSRFLDLLEQTGVIPRLVGTQNYATRAALAPLAEKLGFRLLAARGLPAVAAIRKEILNGTGVELV
ncbi:hypothetical protein [Gelria sp. Kuro-4]|uniref:DUF7309 domain-containing protein n=1 Tax=Gelria sp. Kuro-4 TaxID=2796927 RepID=UPI001BEE4CFA|nr:hypothetical protein [Gelria sp. Kuro-4]BCV23918.1 hypothetical protein kuro4_06910 [Gelria sp. Kuro-4]